MTPARTNGKTGNFEFDRRFPGVGRIRCTSGTAVLREYRRRDAILTKLYETSQVELLKAFRDELVTIEQLVEHDRHSLGGETLLAVRTRESLTTALERALPLMGRTAGTRDRYALSLRMLRQRAQLGESATVASLTRLDWVALHAAWPAGPADWNRMRTAVSRFLSIFTGDKYSSVRRQIVAKIPLGDEPEGRTPDLTPSQFLAIVDRITDDEVVAALMVMTLTAMRVGEYLSLDATHLQPGYRRIRVPREDGNKSGSRVITVGEEAWAWVESAVPFAGMPLPAVRPKIHSDPRYRRIWRAWRVARDAEGVGNVRVHDLRHCAGQWASDEGVSDRGIQQLYGHKDPRMTARYTKQKDARVASAAVGTVLKRARGA